MGDPHTSQNSQKERSPHSYSVPCPAQVPVRVLMKNSEGWSAVGIRPSLSHPGRYLFPAHAEHHFPNGGQRSPKGGGVPEPQIHLSQLHGETLGITDHKPTAGEDVSDP